ncbi:MAG: hypothetical protein IJH12_07275 [Clostridia bacterium]|nr:hypothetical protein [Clostridia bacterium]
MDFSKYNNINETLNKFGGMKQTLLNKNLYANAMQSWEKLSEEDLKQIDVEINNAVELKSYAKTYRTLVTKKAILVFNLRTFTAIPVNDILWIYNRVVVQKMNFIPINKTHYLTIFTKDGDYIYIGENHTGGFSKKMPNDEEMAKIKSVLDGVRKGIVYGADEEMYRLCTQDLAAAIEKVENASME